MSFKQVIGQTELKRHLIDMVEHNRLSHALLFLGPEGCGALSLALAFAQYIVCEKTSTRAEADPGSGKSLFGTEDQVPVPVHWADDACGVCAACIKARKLIHPDIHFSYPVIPKK